MSLFSFFALANASGPQGYQSTGLCACRRRYGLVSLARRLVNFGWAPCASLAAGFSSARSKTVNNVSPVRTARVRQRPDMVNLPGKEQVIAVNVVSIAGLLG